MVNVKIKLKGRPTFTRDFDDEYVAMAWAQAHAAEVGATLDHISYMPTEPILPEPGTRAFTARLMSEVCPEHDWDAWKEEGY